MTLQALAGIHGSLARLPRYRHSNQFTKPQRARQIHRPGAAGGTTNAGGFATAVASGNCDK